MNCNKFIFHLLHCCSLDLSLLPVYFQSLSPSVTSLVLTRFQLIYFEIYLFNVVSVVVVAVTFVVFYLLEISCESVCRVFIQSTCSLLTYTHGLSLSVSYAGIPLFCLKHMYATRRCCCRRCHLFVVVASVELMNRTRVYTNAHICFDIAAVVEAAVTATPCYHASYLNTVIGVQSVCV